MISISLCMIVKNEERVLGRCLDSLKGLMDEIIIVDTGSTDSTRDIALSYTDKVYDFKWIDDFSAARNFAFSKATMDYIYSADADEVLLPEHREGFRILKENLLPEIEIVQMLYGNQLSNGTVYNFDTELRPKLYRRLRTFTWEEAIHEAVRLDPIIFDSDVVITHMPEKPHGGRDLEYFRRLTGCGVTSEKGSEARLGDNADNCPSKEYHTGEGAIDKITFLSNRLHHMYAMELYLSGADDDFVKGKAYFSKVASLTEGESDETWNEIEEACLIAARASYIEGDVEGLFRYSSKLLAVGGCSEIGVLLGEYFEARGEYSEALFWYNCAMNVEPILKAASKTEEAPAALARLQDR